MRLGSYFIFLILLSNLVHGSLTTSVKPEEPQKMADEIKKLISSNDISSVTARIRVEDAQFRAFKLFLPPCESSALDNAQKKLSLDIRSVLERDLAISGTFHITKDLTAKLMREELLKAQGMEGWSKCQISFNKDKIRAILDHKNFLSGKATRKSFEIDSKQYRRLAHLMAQSIFEEFIGPENLFLLQFAAVKRVNNTNQIVMFDFDGGNETVITSNSWSKSSPYFSPDGKSILYSVINDQGHAIVEQNIGSPHFQFRFKTTGLNIDPRVLPDNSGLLATLSFGKIANIYRSSRTGERIVPVTEALGMNLSPTISPDGTMIAFVSNRGGSAQIYEQLLPKQDGKIPPATRLTFKGSYNQTPHYSSDGRFIAFTGRDENAIFDIFIYERASKNVVRVTQNQGRSQEPFFTPSNRYLIFVGDPKNGDNLNVYLASLQGNHQYCLTSSGGYLSPVIKPLAK